MAPSKKHHKKEPEHHKGYETRDAHFKNVMLIGAGLMGLMILILVFVWVLYKVFPEYSSQPGKVPETFTEAVTLPPTPRLQANPYEELVRLHATEDSVLTSYGWNGKDSAFVRIPIARAMETVLANGLPARQADK